MTPFTAGHRITLLHTGDEYFPTLDEAIDAATDEIHLESYLYEDDATGRRVTEALARAAARGVLVRVLVDGYGARNLVEPLRRRLLGAGAEVLVYRPERGLMPLRRYRLRRLHRKLAVIDGRIGFCGGINVIDDRDAQPGAAPRFDFAVRVEGPVVEHMRRAVRRLWTLVQWTTVGRRPRMGAESVESRPVAVAGDVDARFVVRDNLRNRRAIEERYLEAIGSARREIVIANAYFLPGRTFRRALREAAARGARVRLLLQGLPDHLFVHYASRALYGHFMQAGVEIHTYLVTHLHAKVAVIDGQWATVGSSNIDPFSLLLSREANVFVRNAGFAAQLRDSLEHAIATGSVPIVPDTWAMRPWYERALAWSAFQLSRVVAGLTGYGRRGDL